MNPLAPSITTSLLAQAETGTATWAVLMVVLSVLIAGAFAIYRALIAKVARVEHESKKSESKLADARHDEIKTMVREVNRGVHDINGEVKQLDGRVNTLEIGHAKLKERVNGQHAEAGGAS